MQDLDKKSYPSENQIREFWEWCGLHYNKPTGGFFWDSQDNLVIDMHKGETGVDLNSLFQHAVPKLCLKYIELEIHLDYLVKSDSWNVALLDGFYDKDEAKYLIAVKNDKNPALALFWVIYGVIKK